MKKTGKGRGISITRDPIPQGRFLGNVTEGCPVRKWVPLRSWPATPHPQQAALDVYRAYPSLYS